MKKLSALPILLFLFMLLTVSCSEYDKIVKSADMEKKYQMALKYYDKKDFVRAMPLFEELVGVFRGTARAEEVQYYYAYSNYNLGDYLLASFHFRNYVRNFPAGKHAEECAYMNAYCYYLNSPSYSLDQQDTQSAIEEFQDFVNRYPESDRVKDCNEKIDLLRAKLQRKSFETAEQYFNIEDYKASIVALNNHLRDYPDSPYRERTSFLILKSHYLLAVNSIESKKSERLRSTVDSYYHFVDKFPSSEYLKTAESIYENTIKLQAKK